MVNYPLRNFTLHLTKKRRGYFFVLDAMLGLLILVVAVFLVSSSYVSAPQPTQVELLSDDLLNFLSSTKIKGLNNPYAGIGGELWEQGEITEPENSLLQQIGEFYDKYNASSDTNIREKYLTVIEKFIINTSQGVVPTQYRYEVWVGDADSKILLYPKNPASEHLDSKLSTKLLLTSKKIIFGIKDKATGEIWGPYKAEVFVWET